MGTNSINQVSYGLSQALINEAQVPIVAKRAPTVNDKAQKGTIWVDETTNEAYIETSIVNNMANWEPVGAAGGGLTFVTTGGNATSVAGILNVANGPNITVTGAGSTLTINSSAQTAITWHTVTTNTQMVSNNGYFVNGADTVTLTLPTIASIGDRIEIRVLATAVNSWIIAQNAGQSIVGNSSEGAEVNVTTVGVTGNVNAYEDGQNFSSISLVCATTNDIFVASNYINDVAFN